MSKEKKIIAAKKAFEYVEEGMKLGLGTGSTADEFTKILSDNVKDGFQITCVPTSENTKKLAESLEIPLGTLEDYNILDLTIDGADEFYLASMNGRTEFVGSILNNKHISCLLYTSPSPRD